MNLPSAMRVPVLRRTAKLLIALGTYSALARLLRRGVREWLPDGRTVPFTPLSDDQRPVILVLQGDRMEPDMRVLATDDRIRVLDLNEPWLSFIAFAFLPEELGFTRYVARDPDPEMARARTSLRKFLRRFLPHFYRRVPVDCVVRTDLKLQSDFDWSAVSQQLGVPYVLLQRENFLGQGRSRLNRRRQRDRAIGGFEGSHIITYNEPTSAHYVESGVVGGDKISVLGCLRMDELVDRLRQPPPPPPRDGRITLFDIRPNVVRHKDDDAPKRMFEDVYAGLAEIARDRPDVSVVVKIKKQYANDGLEQTVTDMLRPRGLDLHRLANLSFTADGDAHSHILASDVVIGMRSTTLLEGAVFGRPVILPLFAPLRCEKYMDELTFIEDLDIFDLPRDKAEFRAMIERRLAAPKVSEAEMRRRWEVFEKYFFARSGHARERVVNKLLEVSGRGETQAEPAPARIVATA